MADNKEEVSKTKRALQKTGDALIATWNWLDGKKTTIGNLALLGTLVFPQYTVAYTICAGLGIVFGSAGVAHKVAKNSQAKKAEK